MVKILNYSSWFHENSLSLYIGSKSGKIFVIILIKRMSSGKETILQNVCRWNLQQFMV